MAGTAQEWNNFNLMQQLENDLRDGETLEITELPEAWGSPWRGKTVQLTEDASQRRVPRFDEVDCPKHYNNGKVEAIEAIKASMSHDEYLGYLKGNAIKYLWRYRYKGKPLQDLQKAAWYLDKLQEENK